MNRLFITLTLLVVGTALTGCGGGGGGGGGAANGNNSNTAKLFQDDLNWLKSSTQTSAKATNNQFNGAVTKAFGGDQPLDVYKFVSARVKHVYSHDEVNNFRITVSFNGQSESALIKDLMGEEDISNGEIFQAGANVGAALAYFQKQTNYDVLVALPTGPLKVNSFRVGLVSLTKYYAFLPDDKGNLIPIPPEGRVSVLVHEGRHSDCPQGIQSDDCAFGHRICPSGPAAGEPACDNSIWGPYALGGVYLTSTLTNYPQSSLEFHIVQFMADDSFSRLSKQQFDALSTTEPLLGSM